MTSRAGPPVANEASSQEVGPVEGKKRKKIEKFFSRNDGRPSLEVKQQAQRGPMAERSLRPSIKNPFAKSHQKEGQSPQVEVTNPPVRSLQEPERGIVKQDMGANRNAPHLALSNTELEPLQLDPPDGLRSLNSRTSTGRTDDLEVDLKEAQKDRKLLERDLRKWTDKLREANEKVEQLKGEVDVVQQRLRVEQQKRKPNDEVERSLRKTNDALSAEISSLNAKLMALQPLKSENDNLQHNIDIFRGQADRAEKELQLTKNALVAAQADHEVSRGQLEDMRSVLNAASDDISRLQSESRSLHDDQFFRNGCVRLQSDIENWSKDYFQGPTLVRFAPDKLDERSEPSEVLLELSNDCEWLLRDNERRQWLIQAWIWAFIEEHILDHLPTPDAHSKGLQWAHPVQPAMQRLEKLLRPAPNAPDDERRVFFKWRATTAKLITDRHQRRRVQGKDSIIPIDDDRIKWYVESAWDTVEPWMASEDQIRCKKDLDRILRKAIDLDAHISAQWCQLFLARKPVEAFTGENFGTLPHNNKVLPAAGFAFNSESMTCAVEGRVLEDGDPIGLVVSPALIRSGDANGEGYSELTILLKRRVLPRGPGAESIKDKQPKHGGFQGFVNGVHKGSRWRNGR